MKEKENNITFESTGLDPLILKALHDLGFENPTEIQKATIPHLLSSQQDLVALAQTGTGKTAAFSLPIIQQIDQKERHVQAIVLCPTRELCMQIARDIENFTKHLGKISVTAVYGGSSIVKQMDDLRRGCQIVVGTPGRVNDLINRKKLKIDAIKWLVLDEADEMLSMGFQEELDTILAETPKEKQTLLFSATMPKSVEVIARKYMKHPFEINVGQKNTAAKNIQHLCYMVHDRDRYQALRRIVDLHPNIYGIVFCRTKRETQEVADNLMHDHYSAEAIHGDLTQQKRTQVMNLFRKKQIQLLVATDVAARGIDVKELTHVINYNLPDDLEAYIHRSGRTGRANQSGISIAIINMREKYKIGAIERKIGKNFEFKNIPSGKDICGSQLFSLIEKIKSVPVNEELIKPYLPLIDENFKDLTKEDIIKHLVSMEFARFLSAYENAPDLNVKGGSSYEKRAPRDRGDRDDRGGRGSRGGEIKFAAFMINLGTKHGFSKKEFFAFVNGNRALKGVEIGRIEVGPGASKFEVDETRARDFVTAFKKVKFKGVPVVMQSL